VILRNYEGVITSYQEPENYQSVFCDRYCEDCQLSLKLDDADEYKAIGIEKLLSHDDDAISLIPEDNERHQRREDDGGTHNPCITYRP
jgi:lysine 2,3-aminomutase